MARQKSSSQNLKISLKVLLPSLINQDLFDFPNGTSWREIYQKYEEEGIDRNPFVSHLHKYGVEVVQFWINFEIAQKSWAKEFKAKYIDKNWYLDILEAQILHEKPDVIYNTTLTAIPYSFIEEVKKKLKKTTLWISYYGVPRVGEFRRFNQYDLFLTGFRELEKELSAENQVSHFFPHYFDDRFCSKSFQEERKFDFSFIGSLCYKFDDHGFNYRRRLVQELMDECNLRAYSHLNEDLNSPKEALRQRLCAVRYEIYNLLISLPKPLVFLSKLPLIRQVREWEVRPNPDYFFNARLTPKVLPPKYGKQMYDCLAQSKMTLNVHGQVDANFGQIKFAAGNIRLFEATASGCCLLTDDLPNLKEFFKPDEEIVTYSNHLEAREKALFLMNNQTYAKQIAQAGHKRAWQEHSSSSRAIEFVKILDSHA